MAKASHKPIRVHCPACHKRIGKDKAKSTDKQAVYPAQCPHCQADLAEAKAPHQDTPPGKTKEELKREQGVTAIKEQCLGGRPTKLSWELIYDVGQYMRIGAYATTVMAALGIKERTWYAWLDKALKAESKPLSRRTKADQLYMAFGMVVEHSEAEGELALLLKINRGSFGWQGSAWILERKYPDKYGRARAEAPSGGSLDALVEAIGKVRAAKT